MNSLSKLADKHAEEIVVSFRQLWLQEFGDYDDGETFMEYLNTFETGFRSAFRGKLAIHLRKRNASLPISKLPPELLQQIFYFTLFDSGNRGPEYLSEMISLRSVSSAWRDRVNGYPLLWTEIKSSDPPAFIREAFECSKECPLRLTYRGCREEESGSAFLDQAVAHLHRWQSISIDNATYSVMINYFKTYPPFLECMSLSSIWRSEEPIRLFGGLWTPLEELRDNRWHNLDWRNIQSGWLRTLEIEHCEDLELSAMLGIMRENQHLEVLKLSGVSFLSLPPLSHSPCLLPKLRVLGMTGLRISSSNVAEHHAPYYILRQIQFPSCTCFVLETSFSSDPETDFEEFMRFLPSPEDILTHPSADLPTSLSASRSLKACFSFGEFAITTGGDTGNGIGFDVSLGNVPRAITRHWLHSILGGNLSRTIPGFMLSAFIEEQHLQLDDIAYFQEWEAITHLSIQIDAFHHKEEVELRMLATPHTSALGVKRMAFPGLRFLKFWLWRVPREAIVEMIRKRFGTPEVETCVPEIIVVGTAKAQEEFAWTELDEICNIDDFQSIWFGPMSSTSSRPLSPV
ncbi:hypothetical protein M407DRAFT_21331 [Tulasnella calospora MUT 4182]|uniref:Uncharacterized protein n=1 Tax=Tulasnella calospora MUT 4182 TaxID=1051891 RepID=A0A0C3QEH8_9AGAM|nr:hypothetical protein M407DRAFT_21331 [Tulasnella calospora MUT 4182]